MQSFALQVTVHRFCFSEDSKLQFRRVDSLSQVRWVHSMAPTIPERLWATDTSSTLYLQAAFTIKSLNCSSLPCKLTDTCYQLGPFDVKALCFSERARLLFASCTISTREFVVPDDYSLGSVWQVEDVPASHITTDGSRFLFLCDSESGKVRVCSLRACSYITSVFAEDEEWENPWWMAWCSQTGSLLLGWLRGDAIVIKSVRLHKVVNL